MVYSSSMTPAQLALELRARRLKASWTQTDLAKAIGSTQPSVARVEAGGVIPSLPFVDRWVRATGYPLTLTLGETPKTLTSRQKGQLVRDVLGDDVFDPWERLEEKRARGMNVEPERRYLMSMRQPRKKAKKDSSRG
jgi:transcriptional regulator with XRE-family HTH domain